MMPRMLRRRQPLLLDRYWASLRRDRNAAPPVDLDVELAQLAAFIERELQPNNASGPFLNRLEQRIREESAATGDARTWEAPVLDRTRSFRHSDSTNDTETGSVTRSDGDRLPLPFERASRRREAMKLAAGVLAFVLVGTMLALLLRGGSEQPPEVGNGATIVRIPMGRSPVAPAFGAGSLWVADQRDGTLTRIDPATNEVVASIPIMPRNDAVSFPPGPNVAVAVAGNIVWVTRWDATLTANPVQALIKIDATTNQIVATVPLDFRPRAIAADAGNLWVSAEYHHAVFRIDAGSLAVTATIPVASAGPLVLTDGAVWVISDQRRIARIDPTTNQVVATVSSDRQTLAVAATDDAAWFVNARAGSLFSIDPATNAVSTALSLERPIEVAAGMGAIWVLDESGTLTRFDPERNEITATYQMGVISNFNWPHLLLAVGGGSVWVTDENQGVIVRVSP